MANNRQPTDSNSLDRIIRGVIGGMFFIRTGFLEKFDADQLLAEVTPAIAMKKSVDGKVDYQKFPKIVNVPVIVPFAQTAGWLLTIPMKQGDEGTLLISDRFLDDFTENGAQQGNAKPEACGGENRTTEPRIHHLADAIYLPGVITQPFAKKIKDWSTENIEMRDLDRKKFISLGPEGIELNDSVGNVVMHEGATTVTAPKGITMTDTSATVTIKDGEVNATDGRANLHIAQGRVSINAPSGFYVSSPNFNIDDGTGDVWATGNFRTTGSITAGSTVTGSDVRTASGFSGNSHRHSGVETGGGTTGTFV